MSKTTQGKRRPDNTRLRDLQAGDYSRQTWVSNGPEWHIRDPSGRGGALTSHMIVEHEDDTITVSPSILDPNPGGWHGYLERGVWREC